MADAISKAIINYKDKLQASIQSNLIVKVNPKPKVKTTYQEASNLFFKIQIAASKNRIATKAFNFKGLSPITREKSGKIYRYYYQTTFDYDEAKNYLINAKKRGYSNAFLVAYDGDKKITITQALELLK